MDKPAGLLLTEEEMKYLEDLLFTMIREGSDSQINLICDIHSKIKLLMAQPVLVRSPPFITNDKWLENLKKMQH